MTLHVVVGGQFGSEAKGHVTAALAQRLRGQGHRITAVRVAGPNAGHTAIGVLDNEPWALRQIPAVAVVDPEADLVLAAGSEIDPEVLYDEVERLDKAGYQVSERLFVHSQATVIEDEHKEAEGALVGQIGSTGKGIGAARAARLMRRAHTWGSIGGEWDSGSIDEMLARRAQRDGRNRHAVLIEGTQGYGLGLHAGYYPHCTSSNCRAVDFMAMAGVSPPFEPGGPDIWVVLRTYPIRVAGNSGPMHEELTWEQLAERTGGYIKPERTTVTKKIRRVGEFDVDLAKRALAANGGSRNVVVALMFVDYWYPGLAGITGIQQVTDLLWKRLETLEKELECSVGYIGTGPGTGVWL